MNIKELILNKLNDILDNKIETIQKAIELAKESRDNDTKSSVGDKYETGRVMMQIELENKKVQLSKAVQLKNELSQINLQKKHHKVEFGSLVKTNHGNYFISIGIGKLEVDNEACYSISLASPIGKLLQGKVVGDSVRFRGREFVLNVIQ